MNAATTQALSRPAADQQPLAAGDRLGEARLSCEP